MDSEVIVTPSSASPQTPATRSSLAAKQRESRRSTATTPAFLSNLGRATLRGIRKCPQCGVYNGTRGLSCKNKACGESFGKEQEAGGGGAQVFSVCHRGRGTTQWGFVELVPTDTAIATGDGATLLTRINLGRCFLPSCRQGESLCVHIKQAIDCRSRATPLTFKSSVLEALQASVQAREELWRLATESPGPLVQRVSKDTLVVKCHTDSQHPLGLLHLTVAQVETQKNNRSAFHCSCQLSAGRMKHGADGAGSPPAASQPCLHFYACVCAFSSNEKLAAEFAAFQNAAGDKPAPQAQPNNSPHKAKKQRLDEPASGSRSEPDETFPVNCVGFSSGSAQVVDELTVTMGFQQWLASVTERIHQTMHYQFDGKPQPLVYHIPQEFFNALQQRLSLGSKKRRLPNLTTAFVRNDGLPLGSFSKYTWHFTNLLHVKHIFDTPELPLEVTQSFVRNLDGSYSRFHLPELPPEPDSLHGYRTERPPTIRPMEHRTFLKVGTSGDQGSSPFVIEWIPDVLPRCQMGELRVSFEFGHQQSGQSECQEKAGGAEKKARRKSDGSQPKVPKSVDVLQVVV
uniref:Putative treble-clef zinc-finger domain-containing protein n=1 Tax=Xiphophorus couchianus TaxID=32473 RepID=A0A3B5MVZ1_9TELE